MDTLASVNFYYYYDVNGNNQADDIGVSWTSIGSGTVNPDNPSEWTVSWDSTSLIIGQYLIGIEAIDDQDNVTWSFLTQAQIDASETPRSPDAGETFYPNPTPEPGVTYGTFNNSCGRSVRLTKAVDNNNPSVGANVEFTLTVDNNTDQVLTVNRITDILPAGFTFVSTDSGSLGAEATPNEIPTGTLTWDSFSSATVLAGGTGTLIFTAKAPLVEGTYSNISNASVTVGGNTITITSNPVEISLGAPYLTISKSSDKTLVSPGEEITYTITYSNNAPVNVTNVVITDELPLGLTFVSATNGGSYASATRTITWNVGSLASLEGPYTVSYQVTIDADASASLKIWHV
jgi:uncharacterized repeat protein (TIGR01451 family)